VHLAVEEEALHLDDAVRVADQLRHGPGSLGHASEYRTVIQDSELGPLPNDSTMDEEEMTTMVNAALPLTPRMQKTLVRASQIAEQRGHTCVGTEHVLLALLDDPRGIGGGVIHRMGVAPAIRDEVNRIVDSPGYSISTTRRLDGSGRGYA
jgi:hypothetical protein